MTDQEQTVLRAIAHVGRGGMAEVAKVVKAVSYPKATTKKILVSLADKGAVALHRHDYAASLSPADRKLMVRRQDGQGRWHYYGAVSVMKKNPNASQSAQWERLWANYIAALKALDKPIKGANARAALMRLGKAEKAIERFDREAYEKFVVGRNPGGMHLPGLPAIAQREYEDILKSSKAAGRYKGREKEVAARTVRKQHGKNPVMMAAALLSIANSLKVKNPYTDIAIKGSATRVAEGWKIGKKVFPWGRGAMQVKPHVWLDKSTGFYYVKKERNMPRRKAFKNPKGPLPTPQNLAEYKMFYDELHRLKHLGPSRTSAESALMKKIQTALKRYDKGLARSSRRKNIAGFKDADGTFHPIRSGVEQTASGVRHKAKKKYKPSAVGEKRTYAKKRKPAKKKASKKRAAPKKIVRAVKKKATKKRNISWNPDPKHGSTTKAARLEIAKQTVGSTPLYVFKWMGKWHQSTSEPPRHSTGIVVVYPDGSVKPLKAANPRKVADPTLVERYKIGKAIISIRSTPDGKYTASWTIQGVPGYQTGISPSGLNQYQRRKFNTIAEAKHAVAGHHKNPKKKKRSNPTASQIRKTFAGRHKKNSTLYFPDGTPQGIAKLGKLIKIKLKRGHPIALQNPAGEVWLCCDENYKLHLGSTINAPLYDGPARDLGEVKEIEYQEAKPHLGYPKTIWFHHMGEEGGARPHLHVTKKGELKFKGGDYRITSRGIEN